MSVECYDDVLWLDAAMNDVDTMQISERQCDFRCVEFCHRLREALEA
jgi:hypothetical protein